MNKTPLIIDYDTIIIIKMTPYVGFAAVKLLNTTQYKNKYNINRRRQYKRLLVGSASNSLFINPVCHCHIQLDVLEHIRTALSTVVIMKINRTDIVYENRI